MAMNVFVEKKNSHPEGVAAWIYQIESIAIMLVVAPCAYGKRWQYFDGRNH